MLALVLTQPALADEPTVRLDAGDQRWAKQALLRAADFGRGWRGGPTQPARPTAPACTSFSPKASDLVITGYASASFRSPQPGVQVTVDSQVLETSEAVRTDFARTIRPALLPCIAEQLRQEPNASSVTVTRVSFPKIGRMSAAYRATITIRANGRTQTILSDFVFIGDGRIEYSLTFVADPRYGPRLPTFEAEMARILVRRGARSE